MKMQRGKNQAINQLLDSNSTKQVIPNVWDSKPLAAVRALT